ncbi:D-2-hydroxyacid dehydrogenase family protein [Streptacidiphilus pinicola]|uniref:D-2-hydroxyacid dehydrogenase family protein n=1 Tax=Streptacidiphilus pinicola TaxID=2219663 RepID=A0A2X0JCW9_9ACTN|nr:D-2-hydroxyacid dehydrogenase family protein [Streptacidiphilus pinicola]RAG85468.1 D-2-hydroxyacid dehydrogenase family protein [Streptacidiphilus pinicola]
MKVAVLDDYLHVALSLADWDSLGARVDVFDTPFHDEEAVVAALADYEVVVAMRERTPFPGSTLSRLPKLALLVTTGPGNAAIDLDAARRQGVTVTATRYFPQPTVELTWALILAAARLIPENVASVRSGGWQVGLGTSLNRATLGILGLGVIGRRVAEVGRAFGMETVAWSQNLRPEDAQAQGVTYVSREELFAHADVLSVHLRLSERTRGIVGAEELHLMKPTAILVNTSRGPLVDEAALLDALDQRRIAVAALDVFDREPLPAGHPLRSAPNALLTPHVGYVTRDLFEVFYRDAVEDIAAWAAGAPVRVLA